MKFCVIGMGHIGIPTALLLADALIYEKKEGSKYDENIVLGFDIIPNNWDSILNKPELKYEKGFPELLARVKKNHTLQFVDILPEADVFIVAVPTSVKKTGRDGRKASPDLSPLKHAVRGIAKKLRKDNTVIIESTVPVGTVEKIVKPVLDKSILKRYGVNNGGDNGNNNPAGKYHLIYSPERVMPGNMLEELCNNPRIIGAFSKKGFEKAKKVYSLFCKGRLFYTDVRTAEIIKLMENTYRAVNISLANEFSEIAFLNGIDCHRAIALANTHPRVKIHLPGAGFGGYCLTKDPYFLLPAACSPSVIASAMILNEKMPEYIYHRLLYRFKRKTLAGKKIAIYGITYKADVPDIRESPSLRLGRFLESKGALVKYHDPFLKDVDKLLYSCKDTPAEDIDKGFYNNSFEPELEKAVIWSDMDIIVVPHSYYKHKHSVFKAKKLFDLTAILQNSHS